MHLGELPTRKNQKLVAKSNTNFVADTFGEVNELTKIETPDELTEEQLMFYSSQGHEQVEA